MERSVGGLWHWSICLVIKFEFFFQLKCWHCSKRLWNNEKKQRICAQPVCLAGNQSVKRSGLPTISSRIFERCQWHRLSFYYFCFICLCSSAAIFNSFSIEKHKVAQSWQSWRKQCYFLALTSLRFEYFIDKQRHNTAQSDCCCASSISLTLHLDKSIDEEATYIQER